MFRVPKNIHLVIALFVPLAFFNTVTKAGIDSLRFQFNIEQNANVRYEIQKSIGKYYYSIGDYDSALIEYKKAIDLVPPGRPEQKGEAVYRVARVYHRLEDIKTTIYYYKIVYQLYLQAKSEPVLVADVLKDLGRAYYDNAQYDSAMVFYVQAKELYETNKIFNVDHGVLYHYIGSVFKRQGNMDKACEYYQLQIDYGKKYNFLDIIAEGFYLQASCVENDTAKLRHELKALRLYEQMQNEQGIALMYNNVALGYQDIGMLDSAYYYNMLSLEFRRKDGGKSHLASSLANIGDLLVEMGRFDEAEKYLVEAESIAFQTGLKKHIRLMEIYESFFDLHYTRKNYKAATEYLLLMNAYEDSATDAAHEDAIHEMEIAYQTEKNEAEIARLELEKNQKQFETELAKAEAAKESTTKKVFMFSGIAVLLLAGFAFFKWRQSLIQKKIISKQKMEVEFQKELVDEKNKDITDSMNYASTIQRAIITSEEYISKMFNDFFIIYKPRDIVSGDFYWAYHADDGKKFIAVGDCTGHGVPGAMMSMLGTAFLNEVVIEGKEIETGKILDRLRNQVKMVMSRDGVRDGMDMSFCCVDGNKLSFSGANLPVYILRDSELYEIKGDKQPVGYQLTSELPFTVKEFELKQHDKIYLFSDGYADQFGGPKGKKFKYKSFRDKFIEIGTLNFKTQSKIISEEFESWKGDLEQLDDVCVIGISV